MMLLDLSGPSSVQMWVWSPSWLEPFQLIIAKLVYGSWCSWIALTITQFPNDDHFNYFHSSMSFRIWPIFQGRAEMLPLQQAFLDYPREIFLISENIIPLITWHILFYLYLFALRFLFPFRLITPWVQWTLRPTLGRNFKTVLLWLDIYQ